MATIREIARKFGSVYKVEVCVRGQRESATFDRKSEAVKWGEEVEHALFNGLPLPGEEIPKDDKTIKKAVEEYLFLMEQVPNRSRHTKKSDGETGNRLISTFGALTLRTLAREDIEKHKSDRLQVVGPATIRHDMSMLSRIYETARIEWRMTGLDYPGKDVKLPAPPPNRKMIVAGFQFEALLDECRKSKNDKLYPLVALLLSTGMRPSEAILLRWRQVLLDEGVINLTKTKTVPRRVPIPDDCREWLRSMKGDAGENDLIFTDEANANKDKPVRFYRRAFEQACIRAKINAPKKRDVGKKAGEGIGKDDDAGRVTLYTLRHSAASYLVMNGIDIRSVADILGHSNLSQTMRYTHVIDEHKRAAVNNPNLPWKIKKVDTE